MPVESSLLRLRSRRKQRKRDDHASTAPEPVPAKKPKLPKGIGESFCRWFRRDSRRKRISVPPGSGTITGSKFASKIEELIGSVWDVRSPAEQMLCGAIWLVVIQLCITTTYLSYFIKLHHRAVTLRHDDPDYDFCEKPLCLTYASEHLGRINFSIDPCEDFQAFACNHMEAAHSPGEEREGRNLWLAHLEGAAQLIQDALKGNEPGEEVVSLSSPDIEFLRSLYTKCQNELLNPNMRSAVNVIRDVMKKIGLPRWPMLEVEDNLNLFHLLRESFQLLGITGVFDLRVQRDLNFKQLTHTSPYSIHIGPPVLNLAPEILALRKANNSWVFAKYEERMTRIARVFRPRVELQGIASEIILLQNYLNQMFYIKPELQDYYLQSLPLDDLLKNMSLGGWHDMLAGIRRGDDIKLAGESVINVWDEYYLLYLNRFFSDPFIKRAVVNYVGWLIVESLGHSAFYFNDSFHYSTPFVPNSRAGIENICTFMAMKLAPATAARIAFSNESYTAASAYVLRIAKEIRWAYVDQLRRLEWMDDETINIAVKKVKAMKIAIASGDAIQDPIHEWWNQNHSLVTIALRLQQQKSEEQIKWLFENGTEDDCLECESVTPFSPQVHYLHRLNKLVIPIVMTYDARKLLELPPVYAFSTIGAMISVKLLEAIMFSGAMINDKLQLESWHSQSTKERFNDVLNCIARSVDERADQNELFQLKYPELLEELTMISGGLSLSYKAYLVFMAKYAEEFVKSNIPEMKLTLHQYFFFQFAMNFCWTTPKKYAEIFNLTGIDDKLRILIPMRTNYRMSRDFVCAKDSVLGTPTKCLVI